MTASIQMKKGRPNYYIVLAYKDEHNGKNKTKWVSTDIPVKGNNKRRVEERRLEILAEYQEAKIDLSKDILFVDFFKLWLENMEHSLAPITHHTYTLIMEKHIIPFFTAKNLRLREIKPAHIQAYVNLKLKTLSANSVLKHLWNLSKCFDAAVRQNLIAFNPVGRIDKPKKIKYTGAQFLSESEMDKLVAAFRGDALETLILFTVFYGLRRSEVVGLKWNSISFEQKTITIEHTVIEFAGKHYEQDTTKNKESHRTVPMPQIIESGLQKLLQQQQENQSLQPNDYHESGYIFTKIDGTVMSPNFVSQHFKRILTKNDLPIIRFHDLRHSSASYLLHLGFSMKEIQMWLGHGDIGTTMNTYVHIDMSAKENLANTLNERFNNFDAFSK